MSPSLDGKRGSLLLLIVASLAVATSPALAQKRVAVLSDIHMCDDAPTCWYQRKVHEPILVAILDNIIANKASISELVLAGDVFDTWTYPFNTKPPSIPQILAAHPNIFGPNGKMGQVLDALNGQVSYMNGNHDLQTTAADLASVVSPVGKHRIKFRANSYNPGGDKRLIIAHGHEFCIFNKPDFATTFAPLPVGHFITRMISDFLSRNLNPGQTAADLQNMGNPNGLDYSNIISGALAKKDFSLSNALIDGVAGKTGFSYTAPIKMFDGSTTTLNAVKANFNTLFTREIAANGGGEVGLTIATKSAVADYDGSFLGWFAQRLAFQRGAEMVLFGHTHIPIGGLDKSLVDYLNTGYLCPSVPDLNTNKARVSFMTVTVPSSPSSPLTPALIQATKQPSGAFTFPTFTAPTTTITTSPAQDFSSYAQIENTQSTPLTLAGSSAFRGYFVHLPSSIPPNSKMTVWVQDFLGLLGSGGTVRFRDAQNRDIVFDIECPTGLYPNSASGGSSFTARSGDPDGPFSSTVPTSGHPLFVKYKVNAGLVQGAFSTSKAGQNSFATSAAGLLPSETASINGLTALSGIVQANDGGRVYSVKMSRISGIYSFRLSIDAQGPSGFFSGSMWLYFTDQSGDRYEKMVFSSTRKTHTLDYNSQAPAIVRIEWSNTKKCFQLEESSGIAYPVCSCHLGSSAGLSFELPWTLSQYASPLDWSLTSGLRTSNLASVQTKVRIMTLGTSQGVSTMPQ